MCQHHRHTHAQTHTYIQRYIHAHRYTLTRAFVVLRLRAFTFTFITNTLADTAHTHIYISIYNQGTLLPPIHTYVECCYVLSTRTEKWRGCIFVAFTYFYIYLRYGDEGGSRFIHPWMIVAFPPIRIFEFGRPARKRNTHTTPTVPIPNTHIYTYTT